MNALESRIVQVDGFDVKISLYQDDETRPTDFECYDEGEIDLFNRGDWVYVGVRACVISRSIPSAHDPKSRYVEVRGPESAGLWGIDFHFDDDSRQYCYEEIGTEEAQEAVRVLRQLAQCAV